MCFFIFSNVFPEVSTLSDFTTRVDFSKPSFGSASSIPRIGTPPARHLSAGYVKLDTETANPVSLCWTSTPAV